MVSGTKPSHQVFISYSTKDQEVAEEVRAVDPALEVIVPEPLKVMEFLPSRPCSCPSSALASLRLCERPS